MAFYVRRSIYGRKPMARKYKKKSSYTAISKRRKVYPSRLRASKKRYTFNKKVARVLHNFSENKLVAIAGQSETPPVVIQTGAQAYFIAYNIGINASTSGGIGVNGIRIAKGTDFNERVGDYIYLKKTHLSIKLEMTNANNSTPTQFRILLVKLRRYNNPAGITPLLNETLFLDTEGQKFGHATSGKTGIDLMMQPTNKRDWVIFKDFKCVLQNYNDITGGSATIYNHYPCFKDFSMNCPFWKKTKYGTGDLPIDIDYRFTLVMYAHNINRSNLANDFETSIRGTTSYTDN